MKINGQLLDSILDNSLMDVIVSFMDDDIREKVHCELAPCTYSNFLTRYIELAPEFEELLVNEFKIEI